MARHPNLMLRNGVWYFRRRVPSELVELWGGQFITKSLRTGDYREAVRRLRIEQGNAQKKLDDLQTKAARRSAAELHDQAGQPMELSLGELEQLVGRWVEQEQERILMAGRPTWPKEDIQDRLIELADEEARLQSPFPEDHEQLVGIMLNQILASAGFPARAEVGSIKLAAKSAGISTIRLSPATHEELYRLVREARSAINAAQQKHLLGGGTSKPVFQASRSPAKSKGYNLAQLINDFRNDPGRASRTDKTELDYGMVFRALTEVIGADKQLDAITRDDFKDVRDLFLSLPRDATKRYRGKSLVEASRLAPETERRLKPKTINSHLTKISTIFNWAVREGKLGQSHARGLVIRQSHEDDEDGRRSFTVDELNAMFSAPLYTGCVDDERSYWKVGPNKPRRSRFWIPLISLFSGLRQNEICQLAVSDIEQSGGIAVIHVRKMYEWQKLKSRSARRFVPVHPELIRIGLLEYASEIQRQGHIQLFPELRPDVRGYMSGIFQKRFNTFRHSVGVSDPDGVFHSFRHTWRDAFRKAHVKPHVPEEIVQAMGGWKGSGQDKEYGNGYTAEALYKELKKVRYPGLELSHLYRE